MNFTSEFKLKPGILLLLITFFVTESLAQNHLAAYKIYNREGKEVTFEQMASGLSQSEIILFGELHNNPIAHWLQFELTRKIFDLRNDDLVLGAEMFEADNQIILDEYLQGMITENHFKNEAKLWRNYETDYKPLVEFAKAYNLPFIATNIPRRYAGMVARNGLEILETIDPRAKNWIMPLPVVVDLTLPGYARMVEMDMGHGFAGENMAYAQAVKDATMAHFILQNHVKNSIFIHFNGSYHSNNYEGIYWYLLQADPGLRVKTISLAEDEDPDLTFRDTYSGLADFVIVVPDSMTKTY